MKFSFSIGAGKLDSQVLDFLLGGSAGGVKFSLANLFVVFVFGAVQMISKVCL